MKQHVANTHCSETTALGYNRSFSFIYGPLLTKLIFRMNFIYDWLEICCNGMLLQDNAMFIFLPHVCRGMTDSACRLF
jgi:hypothetical protein